MVDLSQFDEITEQYPYEEIKPTIPVNYFELLISYGSDDEVLFSSGSKCSDASNPTDCEVQFDSLKSPSEGFSSGCLPNYCYKYLKYQRGNEINVLTNTDELKTFFGEIDSKSEAIMLVVAANYNFSTQDKETGAIKVSDAGYELLVTKLVKDCNPVQTNRYHLEITKAGEINILTEEEYSVSEGACI